MEQILSRQKMKTILVTGILLAGMQMHAEKYWISFADKKESVFDPYCYFDDRAIQQRLQNNIPLDDITDYPVSEKYISEIKNIADSVSWPSRWLNGIAVYASTGEIEKISKKSYVLSIEEMSLHNKPASVKIVEGNLSRNDSALLLFQTQRMQSDSFSMAGFDGKGIRIAVFDAGFPNADKHPAFKLLQENKRIISTYDFVCRHENVYGHHWHGTATLSCIAGIDGDKKTGMATGAEFLLARTEETISEPFSEEENWLAAAEWADKQGVNIISSSLGYTYQRYFNFEMDGHKSLVARAANIAASKGILVVNAAGNEGADSWHYIGTPADADSVLTVGGTDPETDMHIYFSSYGPASNGKLKPNVCAVGEVIVAHKKGYARSAGTSFSTPLVAGFAACAWQSHRQWTNMELFDAIEKSSHLYPYFDYAHGFGIPQAGYFIHEKVNKEPTFDFVIINNEIKVILREEYSYPGEESALGYMARRNFYYKIEDRDGRMKKYSVMLADRKEMMHVFAEDFETGDVLTVHFEGYTSSVDFPEEIKEIK
jgi:serine protease AprX